jgi:hypothetical protein
MKNWFKNLDLERAIILVSLLLMPVAGGWVYYLNNQIKDGIRATAVATKQNGLIERIATLKKQITQFKQGERAGDTDKEPRLYFEKAVRDAQAKDRGAGVIGSGDFSIAVDNRRKSVPGNRKLEDTQLTMHFKKAGRTPYSVGRSFINAFIFNVEAGGARVWKLRNFRMVNELYKGLRGKKQMPPEEIPDRWFPETLVFARRQVARQ